MWHMHRPVKTNVLDKLFGRKKSQLQPVMHVYNTQELAEYGFRNIKANGGYKPYLLKVLKM